MSKTHIAQFRDFGPLKVEDQEFGNTHLNVFPFKHTSEPVVLPAPYKMWEDTLNEILKHIPLQDDANMHYITINSDFFTQSGTQRREGPHMDGNFCVDPTFVKDNGEIKASWGGASPSPCPKPSWSGLIPEPGELAEKADNSHVQMDWVLPYDVVIPIAKYVSGSKGGLFVVSSNIGTKVWDGTFTGEVEAEGSYVNMADQLTDDRLIRIPKNRLVFMTSNTPHETIEVPKGDRRTFMRLTLNHNYNNDQILS